MMLMFTGYSLKSTNTFVISPRILDWKKNGKQKKKAKNIGKRKKQKEGLSREKKKRQKQKKKEKQEQECKILKKKLIKAKLSYLLSKF